MASVFQRGATWYARVKDSTGRWRNLATEARTKTEARRLADDLARRAERVRLGLEAGDRAVTLVVLTVGGSSDATTANLLAPLVVNRRTGSAVQVALSSPGLAVDVPVRPAA